MHIEIEEKWKSLVDTWNISKPPATPSHNDISFYGEFITMALADRTERTALLLGSTPSLRLLMAKMNIAVTCVDLDSDMIATTSALLGGYVTKNETHVVQNWLNMELDGWKYPIIIGDKVLDNVPFESWVIFKEKLLTHLLPNGSVIIRVAPQDRLLIGQTFTGLLYKWSEKYKQKHIPLKEAASGLWEQALGASVSTVPGKQSIREFVSEIDSLIENYEELPVATKEVFSEYRHLFAQSINHEWTSYTLGNIVDTLGEELRLATIKRANDYEVAVRQPILRFCY